MDCFCHIFCPCLCSGKGELENTYDIIPEKGEYYGDTDFKGAKHGHGMFLFSQGDIYEGEWRDDKMHGFGEYRFHDGKILNGYFENGQFIGDPPPGVRPASAISGPRPLTPNSIKSDIKPTKVNHNEASYAFARTVGNITQSITKKSKNKDATDYQERRPLIMPTPQETYDQRTYAAVQGHADPAIAAQIAMERERKQRLRRERVEKIKQKYNIKTDQSFCSIRIQRIKV